MFKRLAVFFTLCLFVAMPSIQAQAQTQPQETLEKALLGRWFSEQVETLPADDNIVSGEFRLVSVDEYHANGTVNTQGQIILFFKYRDGATIESAWVIHAASEWRIKDGSLFEKIVDVQTIPDYVKADDRLADALDQEEFFRQAHYNIEDLIPKGQATADHVISIDGDRFAYESKDDNGKMIRHTKARTQKNFSAYKKF